MAEPEIEPREVLRRTRVEVMPYLREIAEHSRAIIPRMEVSKRWMDYYESLSKVRPLTGGERGRLEEHRKAYNLLAARREVYSAAGRYARTKKPEDLVALRRVQGRYYEAKAETLPPEQRAEMIERMVPAKELYDAWAKVQEDIEAKCKQFRAVKYRYPPYHLISVERKVEIERIVGAELRDDYAKAYELAQKGKEMGELIGHYREMRRLGAE